MPEIEGKRLFQKELASLLFISESMIETITGKISEASHYLEKVPLGLSMAPCTGVGDNYVFTIVLVSLM